MKRSWPLLLCLLCYLTAGCSLEPVSVSDTRFSMDTLIQIEAGGKDIKQVKAATDQAFQVFQAIADETNRYQSTHSASLFALNKNAGKGPLPVGRHLYTLAAFLQNQPLADVDATIGPVIDCWRRHSITKTIPSQEELDAALLLTGREKLRLHPDTQALELLHTGMSLDLGAVAKGYAVDQAALQLAANTAISHALINAGGNIKTIGQKPGKEGWRIAIGHPRNADKTLGVLRLKPNEAVATSGDYQRYYEVDGKRLHHILDHKTGLPPAHTISVTVVADSALLADYYSTLLFLLPRESALKVLAENPEIQCIIVDNQQQLYVSTQLKPRFSSNGSE